MYCCENCFKDDFLIEVVESYDEIGKCDYCNSEQVFIVDMNELSQYFGIVKKLYKPLMIGENITPDDNILHAGEKLFDLFNDSWEVFYGFDPDAEEELFYDLMNSLDSTEDYQQLYAKGQDDYYHRDSVDLWNSLSQKLTKQNRFFPGRQGQHGQEEIDNIIDITKSVFYQQEFKIKKGYKLLRARIGEFYNLDELSSPPENIISVGRANPVGIRMLYCVSNEEDKEIALETAIAEVRAPASSTVTVADIRTNKDLTFVNLSDFERIESVFELNQYADPIAELDRNQLTSHYVSSLSKPILEDTAQIEYISTQYLTALAEHLNFDGIMFRSSIAKGINFVIFDEQNCDFWKLNRYKIEGLKYSIRELKL
ncbi:RES family NAD+ phosphorylase [Shouchella clausii]|uniref:RES family NAD+ phosphorylase n=1 Tax=Shouchella clausii TaxID=79880 RepID=UPI001C238CB1|nr:RES family NAD+ phosphorylase [Shouchella clausii]MBU8597260.1 RES family NAD+ phosphorylase [Shouchella clausii]MED4159621.1 RES family NAD+ phosphorylase [Shouchella clausii]MED4176995.1 RES family NAD+ phosphorylase [Shouchella clausii]